MATDAAAATRLRCHPDQAGLGRSPRERGHDQRPLPRLPFPILMGMPRFARLLLRLVTMLPELVFTLFLFCKANDSTCLRFRILHAACQNGLWHRRNQVPMAAPNTGCQPAISHWHQRLVKLCRNVNKAAKSCALRRARGLQQVGRHRGVDAGGVGRIGFVDVVDVGVHQVLGALSDALAAQHPGASWSTLAWRCRKVVNASATGNAWPPVRHGAEAYTCN